MPSISNINIDYEYTLKILQNCQEISIGIDDSKCKHINDDFSGKSSTKNYSYFSRDGKQYNWETGWCAGIEYGDSFFKGDIIKMRYNPFKATLQFWKNNAYQGVIEEYIMIKILVIDYVFL